MAGFEPVRRGIAAPAGPHQTPCGTALPSRAAVAAHETWCGDCRAWFAILPRVPEPGGVANRPKAV